jgi:hypothetical protein
MASLTVLNDRHIVVIGGLAELFAGALSMGLGQFMTALLKREHFLSEEAREKMEIDTKPDEEEAEIREILERYGVSDHVSHMVVDDLKANLLQYLQVVPDLFPLIDRMLTKQQFMMDFELKIAKMSYREAAMEGVVMAVSYALGKPCYDQSRSAAVADTNIDRWLDANGALFGHQIQHGPCVVRLDWRHSCTLDDGWIPASGPVWMYVEEGNYARDSGVCYWSECCRGFVWVCQGPA